MTVLPDEAPEPENDGEPAAMHSDPLPTLDPLAESLPVSDQIETTPEPLLPWYSLPEITPPTRIPHLGHLLLLCVLGMLGLLAAGALTQAAVKLHLLGVTSVKQAMDDVRYTLGSQAVFYLFTFAACLLLFPVIWHESLMDGLQWRLHTALRLRWKLFGAAFICFVLAIINGVLLPGPTDTPIDRIFRVPGAAWLLFAFGVTLAPFIEEMAFRGFLLPSLCTAIDWTSEHFSGNRPRWPDPNGHPRWSGLAMGVASLLTSVPFALMHAEQTSYAVGPFLLLICVSLVLCWIRLSTRSLAASVMVHSSYNFLLFSLMLAGTGGFRHLDRM